jgi:hypothetical protein
MAEVRASEVRGRPLRALGLLLGGWVAMRVLVTVWPGAPLPRALVPPIHIPVATAPDVSVPVPAPVSAPADRRVRIAIRPLDAPPAIIATARAATSPGLPPATPPPPAVSAAKPDPPLATIALLALVRFGVSEPSAADASRWSGSLWGIVRGRGAAGVATPQLGGSQAGLRLAYALDDANRVTIAGRIATALGTRQQEAAIGVEWKPTRLPVRLVAEQRIGIAGTRGGPGIGVVGGVAEVPLAAGFTLDGYGQAGVIARDGGEGYGDGALRIGRDVMTHGEAALDLGAGAWGAAQRGASRLDIGPSAALTFPIGPRRARLSLDWRQRIAGDARPGSGPALSLGADF